MRFLRAVVVAYWKIVVWTVPEQPHFNMLQFAYDENYHLLINNSAIRIRSSTSSRVFRAAEDHLGSFRMVGDLVESLKRSTPLTSDAILSSVGVGFAIEE